MKIPLTRFKMALRRIVKSQFLIENVFFKKSWKGVKKINFFFDLLKKCISFYQSVNKGFKTLKRIFNRLFALPAASDGAENANQFD